MPQLEQGAHTLSRPLIDLQKIETESRALVWDSAVRHTFPGLAVQMADCGHLSGSIERVPLGPGEFFSVVSGPADVLHQGTRGKVDHPQLSMMVLSHGSIRVRQAGQDAMLDTGDMCVIDEGATFRLKSEESSHILFLRMPRGPVFGRYPGLERQLATRFCGKLPGTRLLADTLQRFAKNAKNLADAQRGAMMAALIHMFAMAEPFAAEPSTPDWRVRRAADYIELNLSVTGLTADTVAQDQNISRRRLDQLMREACSHSIASYLWSRRLEQAAADLRDPQRAALSVAQIAFANGFEDAAHFTRAFKKRYSATPGQWRLN